MKLAIVTIYDALNYGSFLQAYAMQETLRKMGHQVTVLNCSKKLFKQRLRLLIRRKNTFLNAQRYYAYKKNWKLLNICKLGNERYDAVIIGSDEVWNLQGHFEHWPQYLCKELNTERAIAYAPSIGFCNPEILINNTEFKNCIQRLNAICPRDYITYEIAKTLGGKVTERVLDPTLLMLDEWKNIIPPSPMRDDYVVYYSYLDNTPMKPHILRYAKERGLKVIIAGFFYKWGDGIMTSSPLEFLSLISNAKCVFTSTFHGSIFSTIFQKPFLVRPSGQKVTDYLNFMELQDRIFTDEMTYEDFIEIVEKPINYDSVYSIQKNAQIHSLDIFKHVLQSEKKGGV